MTEPDGDATAAPAEGCVGSAVRRAEEIGFTVLLLLLIGLGLAPLAARTFHLPSVTWADTLSRQLVLWVALFGAGAAARDRKHIVIDAVSHFLPPRERLVLSALTGLIAALICAYLTALGSEFLLFMRAEAVYAGFPRVLGIREWWFPAVIPVGMAALSVRFFVSFVTDVRATADFPVKP